MQVTTYGVDLAKRVLQVHWVEPDSGEVKSKMLMREAVAAFFARRAPGLVAMEACGVLGGAEAFLSGSSSGPRRAMTLLGSL